MKLLKDNKSCYTLSCGGKKEKHIRENDITDQENS